ncbi:MAG: Bifunctional protein HldE [Elusimicrobia bacterium]|nr:Bifunctional protein HldE [Elusimicrobiota bacterium]
MKIKRNPKVDSGLANWVKQFKEVPVLVVGDLMVDLSYRGPAERISPEAPVPVIHVQEFLFMPGGAGNVVNNLAVLGARPTLVSLVGDDKSGKDIGEDLRRRGIDVTPVLVDNSRPTITKHRVFAGHQQVARFDFEKRGAVSKELGEKILNSLKRLIPQQKAVVISDYGKGLITPEVIRTCLRAAKLHHIPVIVDPKIENFLSYKGVDCITPNTKEAVEGMRVFSPKTEQELLSLGLKILKKLKCNSLLITRGEKGMTLFDSHVAPRTIPALAQEVYDVTGAGDTVVSTFSLARAVGAPHFIAAQLANLAASLVVAKVGTAVVSQQELLERIKHRP